MPVTPKDTFGLLHPSVDAHTLGVSSFCELLRACGLRVEVAAPSLCAGLGRLDASAESEELEQWLRSHRVAVIGFSYRLDPGDAASHLGRLLHWLQVRRLFEAQGGPVRCLYFAGLPAACAAVRSAYPQIDGCFEGDETPAETLGVLGLSQSLLPAGLRRGCDYDEARLRFGRALVEEGAWLRVPLPPPPEYPGRGGPFDDVRLRVSAHRAAGQGPLMRAHVGPYLPDRDEAVRLFGEWTRRLAAGGLLDVLSVGNSQLSQERFFHPWEERADGGGVPLYTEQHLSDVWEAARPMLVRCYAGTDQVPRMARLLDARLHNAWHALSLWWFSRLDGRGPSTVADNLAAHVETLAYLASAGRCFEANVPHHFMFRGADDVTYVVSAVLAARLAKRLGVPCFVLQLMLNTPRQTWGLQDLAKARATLQLVRELEDDSFKVLVQPRGGLDYFSHREEKAKAQLAAVSALMCDIEPGRLPDIIHVVSWSEGQRLADPQVVEESIRITRASIAAWLKGRARGEVPDPDRDSDVGARTHSLLVASRHMLAAMEASVPALYSASGFYEVLRRGYFPMPWLWCCREEFKRAVSWNTRLIDGGMCLVDQQGRPVGMSDRLAAIAAEEVLP